MYINRLSVSVCFLVSILYSAPVLATTWHVPGDSPTIQAGIDAAAAGDTVLVACGTYQEFDLVMKAGVTLRGDSSDPTCVVIDAQNQGRILDCVDLLVLTRIENLTFKGGYVVDGWLEALGGGVRAMGSNVAVTNCRFQSNGARIGAGFGASDSNIEVVDCTFDSNAASHAEWAAGGGIWARDCSGSIDHCLVSSNTAFSDNFNLPGDGGGFFFNNSTIEVSDCRFFQNSTGAGAGGFYSVTNDSSVLRNCEFEANSAGNGGAVFYEFGAAAQLIECTFTDNVAMAGGAIVSLDDSYPKVIDCLFEGNQATQFGGGAIECWTSEATITGSTFRDNSAQSRGGGVLLAASSAEVTNCIFDNNSAVGEGGAISCHLSSITATGCTVVRNSASVGAGIYCGDSSYATVNNSIIAFSAAAESMAGLEADFATISCSDFFGNPGGDWVGDFAGQLSLNNNFSADPLFCDLSQGVLTIDVASPCTLENQATCGQVGALGADCDNIITTGVVIIEKRTDPAGSADLFSFSGDLSGQIAAGQELVFANLLPGTYVCSEDVVTGWELTSIASGHPGCVVDLPARTATFTVAVGDTIRATYTNTQVLPPPAVLINEVDADQDIIDTAEFVELYDGGVGNTDLSSLVLVFFNGDDHASYRAFGLSGHSTNAAGYFVLGGDAANVPNCDYDVSPDTDLIQDGADAIALYVGSELDFPVGTPLTTANLIDALVYGTDDPTNAELLVLLNPGQPQVNENAAGDSAGDSNQRCLNGSGDPLSTDTYAQFPPTPGLDNECTVPTEDFGDAPDPSYPTLLANLGARHTIVPGFYLGSLVDGEADGNPTALADGDGLDGTPDDEDGVAFTSALYPNATATLEVLASLPGLLNAWFDFNQDGDWADTGEQIFADLPVAAGLNQLTISIPAEALVGHTFVRFRLSSTGGLSFDGPAADGEVEDYRVEVLTGTVPTVLQHSQISWGAGVVNIGWSLAEGSPGMQFGLLRSEDGSAPAPVAEAALFQEGTEFRFQDPTAEPGREYLYQVTIDSGAGARVFFAESLAIPALKLVLHPSTPNPFNPSTTIKYSLDSATSVRLLVVDLQGKVVRTLVSASQRPGVYSAVWNGNSDDGRPVASGVYFAVLKTKTHTAHQKMLLLK